MYPESVSGFFHDGRVSNIVLQLSQESNSIECLDCHRKAFGQAEINFKVLVGQTHVSSHVSSLHVDIRAVTLGSGKRDSPC